MDRSTSVIRWSKQTLASSAEWQGDRYQIPVVYGSAKKTYPKHGTASRENRLHSPIYHWQLISILVPLYPPSWSWFGPANEELSTNHTCASSLQYSTNSFHAHSRHHKLDSGKTYHSECTSIKMFAQNTNGHAYLANDNNRKTGPVLPGNCFSLIDMLVTIFVRIYMYMYGKIYILVFICIFLYTLEGRTCFSVTNGGEYSTLDLISVYV